MPRCQLTVDASHQPHLWCNWTRHQGSWNAMADLTMVLEPLSDDELKPVHSNNFILAKLSFQSYPLFSVWRSPKPQFQLIRPVIDTITISVDTQGNIFRYNNLKYGDGCRIGNPGGCWPSNYRTTAWSSCHGNGNINILLSSRGCYVVSFPNSSQTTVSVWPWTHLDIPWQ